MSARGAKVYYPAFDGLRALACLMVLFHHTAPYSLSGWGASESIDRLWKAFDQAFCGYGVTLFFALSSFLITTLLIEEKESFGRVHVGQFYIRRVLRIWPLYYLVLILGICLSLVRGPHPISGFGALRYATFTGNIAMSAWGSGAFPFVAPLWSVCVEEQFYLVWPHVVRWLSKDALTRFAIFLIAFGICFRVFWMVGEPKNAAWYHTLSEVDCFGYGCLAALYLQGRAFRSKLLNGTLFIAALVFVICIEVCFPFKSAETVTSASGAIGYTFTAAAFAFAVWLASTMNSGILTTKPMRNLGRISYGFYCFQGIFMSFFPLSIDWIARMAAVSACCYICASTSFQWYETPFLRLKEKFQFIRSGPSLPTDPGFESDDEPRLPVEVFPEPKAAEQEVEEGVPAGIRPEQSGLL